MLKLGTTNINLPFAKAFLGSNLVYQKNRYIDTEFTACPFPTTWTEVTAGTEYTATNDYGEWVIWAETYNSSSTPISKAFDNSTSTRYEPTSISSNTQERLAGINLPTGVTIKPTQIAFAISSNGNSSAASTIDGLNELGEWETIYTLPNSNSTQMRYIDITTENYYSSFRLKLTRQSSLYTKPSVYEFQITSGTIRKEA